MNLKIGMAVATCAALLPALPAAADDSARLKALEDQLAQSQRMIQALQQRLDQLEQQKGAAPGAPPSAPPGPAASAAAAPPPGTWGERIESLERSVSQLGNAPALPADAGLPIHGFADVRGTARNAAAQNTSPRGFNVGVFDLYMTPQISDQVRGLVELAFEYDESGDLAVDAERMQLGYVFNDALTLWAGRFHTPYGYWNTAFHHGAQIQTAISRPRFLDFEDAGGIMPAHSVGLWATGAERTAAGKLGYDVYVVNGDRIRNGTLDFQARGDTDNDLGLGFRVQLAPAGTAWAFGLHGLKQTVAGTNADASASGQVGVTMLGGFATCDDDAWELLTEYYAFRNRDIAGGSGTHTSHAGYAQLGYNLGDRWTPYARWERAALAEADPYFALQESGRSYSRAVAGVRYSLTPKSALKTEWMRTGDAAGGHPASLTVQYAVRF